MDIRHTITRFGATALIGCGLVVTAIPATFAQNGEESVTHVYSDKAASHISEVWYKGETLKITGEGFLTQDGASGSIIAIKLNKGSVKIDGKDYLEVQADEKGNFSVSIPWQSDLDDRISVDVYLLSGSLAENDNVRGGVAAEYTFSIDNQAPAPKASESANAPVTNPSEAPSAPADSKEQVKENAKDQSKAPADSLKSEAQKKDSTAPKTSGSSSQNVASSNNGSTASSSSKSSLANTGASGVVVAAGIGVLALVVGATVLVARRRKA